MTVKILKDCQVKGVPAVAGQTLSSDPDTEAKLVKRKLATTDLKPKKEAVSAGGE